MNTLIALMALIGFVSFGIGGLAGKGKSLTGEDEIRSKVVTKEVMNKAMLGTACGALLLIIGSLSSVTFLVGLGLIATVPLGVILSFEFGFFTFSSLSK